MQGLSTMFRMLSYACNNLNFQCEHSSYKAWPDTKTKHTTGKSKPKMVSGPIVRVIHQSIAKRFENYDYYKVLYWNEMRCKAPVHHTKPYKYYNFQNDGTSRRYYGLWLTLVHSLNLVCSFQWCVFYWCVWSNFSRAAVVTKIFRLHWLPREARCAIVMMLSSIFMIDRSPTRRRLD